LLSSAGAQIGLTCEGWDTVAIWADSGPNRAGELGTTRQSSVPIKTAFPPPSDSQGESNARTGNSNGFFFDKFADGAITATIGGIIAWLAASLRFEKKIDAAVDGKLTAISARVSKFEAKAEGFATRDEIREWMREMKESLHRLEEKLDKRNGS